MWIKNSILEPPWVNFSWWLRKWTNKLCSVKLLLATIGTSSLLWASFPALLLLLCLFARLYASGSFDDCTGQIQWFVCWKLIKVNLVDFAWFMWFCGAGNSTMCNKFGFAVFLSFFFRQKKPKNCCDSVAALKLHFNEPRKQVIFLPF